MQFRTRQLVQNKILIYVPLLPQFLQEKKPKVCISSRLKLK